MIAMIGSNNPSQRGDGLSNRGDGRLRPMDCGYRE